MFAVGPQSGSALQILGDPVLVTVVGAPWHLKLRPSSSAIASSSSQASGRLNVTGQALCQYWLNKQLSDSL